MPCPKALWTHAARWSFKRTSTRRAERNTEGCIEAAPHRFATKIPVLANRKSKSRDDAKREGIKLLLGFRLSERNHMAPRASWLIAGPVWGLNRGPVRVALSATTKSQTQIDVHPLVPRTDD